MPTRFPPKTPQHPDDLLDVRPSPTVPPEQWVQLYRLALTWPLREARGTVTIPASLADTLGAREGWEWDYEERFGATHQEGASVRLTDFVWRVNGLVETGIEAQALYAILLEARQAAIQAALRGRAMDLRRGLLARAARTGIAEWRWEGSDVDLILTAYEARPIRRQQGGGRPAQPWVARAKDRLAQLGVSKEDTHNLLVDVGLIDFRWRRY